MNSSLSSLALVAVLSTAAATAQTGSSAAKTATATHHTASTTAAAKTPSNIPKVVGIPKTLYALKYVDIKVGTGPLAEDTVLGASPADSKVIQYSVKYTGWLTDGTKFDSSDDHPGEPFSFIVGAHRVIPGWDTGFTGMHVGGKRRIFVPWQLAYGAKGNPPRIPPKADLIFDMELVKQEDITQQLIQRATPPPPPSPAKPETPPSGAPPATPPTPPPASQPATPPTPDTPPHPQSL
jgi:peptidylprolyl isomerase